MHSATAIPRMPASFARRRVAACLILAGLASLGLAACSPGADYPSLFPSVHDVPPPRNDSRLDQNQVQQATEDLISARDRLTAEAQSAQAKSTGSKPAAKSPQSPAKSAASSPGKSSAGMSSAGKSSTGKSSTGESSGNSSAGAIQASGRRTLGPDAGQAAGGAETK